MSFTLVLHSNSGVGLNNNSLSFNVDFDMYSKHERLFNIRTSFLSQSVLEANAEPGCIQVRMGAPFNSYSPAANNNGTNNNQIVSLMQPYYSNNVAKYMFCEPNSKVQITNRPQNNEITVSFLRLDKTPFLGLAAVDWTLILHFEALLDL